MKSWFNFLKIIILVLSLTVAVARFVNIDNLAIFHDEAIYINTARNIKLTKISTWKNSFENEVQKPPLILLIGKTVINNTDTDLIRTRQLSVIFGILTILIAYLLIKDFFGIKESLISVVLFSFSPFLFLYQRLFMFESFLLFFYLLSLYVYLQVLKKISLTGAILLFILGFTLTGLKQSIYLWIPSLILFPFLKISFQDYRKLLKPAAILLLGLSMGLIAFWVLSSGQYFSPADTFIIKNINLNIILKNFIACIVWIKSYLTTIGFFITILILAMAFVQGSKKQTGKFILFLALIFFPLLIQSIIARYFLPRYIFLSFGLFLIFLASQYKSKFMVLFLLLSVSFIYVDIKLINNPLVAPLHQNEIWQYLSGSPSGWGVKEISEYILSNNPKASVASIGLRMMPSSGLHYYLDPKDIKITEYANNEINFKVSQEYLVYQTDSNNLLAPPQGYEKILEFRKPLGDTTIYLYKNLHLAKT